MNTTLEKPFAKVGLIAIPLLLVALVLGFYNPKGPCQGFSSAIIAYEFAHTPADIAGIFQSLSPEERAGMDMTNIVDYPFMFLYSGFIFLFFMVAKRHFRMPWLVAGQVLAVLILLGDAFENVQLIQISSGFVENSDNVQLLPYLSKLHFFTWLKWGCLAIAMALSIAPFSKGNTYSKVLAGLMGIPVILAIVAFSQGTPATIDAFSASIFVTMFLMILSSSFLKYPSFEA